MKKVMKNISFLALAVALAAPVMLPAQQEGKEKEKKEAEQIIITRKGGADQKIVVEIDGDKVKINGKEYKKGDGDISISRSRIKDVYAFGGNDGAMSFWNPEAGRLRALASHAGTDRAMLGVTTEKAEKGVLIQSITDESAAEKMGLKEGDFILKIDDTKIETPDDLSKAIQAKKPGDKVKVTYLRDKKESTGTAELTNWKGVGAFSLSPGMESFKMDLGDLNFDQFIAPRINGQGVPRARAYNYSFGGGPKLGLSIQDTEDGKGVKVLEVDEDGNGAKAGIKEDDIITEVDGKAVNSADEIAKIVRESREKISVKMKLLRNGKNETVEVKIPRKLKTADL
jgi:serine protease Do